MHCSKESWHYFVKEAKAHEANPDWNAQQLRATQARSGPRTRLSSGGAASFCNRFVSVHIQFEIDLLCVGLQNILALISLNYTLLVWAELQLQRFGSLPTFEQIEQAKCVGAKRFFFKTSTVVT